MITHMRQERERVGRLSGLVALGLLLVGFAPMGCTSNPTPYPGHGDAHFAADVYVAEPPGTDDSDAKVGAIDDGGDAIDPTHGIGDVGPESQDGDAGDGACGADDVRILVDDAGDANCDDDEGFDFGASAAERVDDR